MKKLLIFVALMTVSITAIANDPIEDLKSYQVVKTDIVNVSPFCISVAQGDYDMVKKMIALGSDVNLTSNDMTPLMYAARYNHTEIIKLLIANGAEINTKNAKGFTAIKYAELSNAIESKELLKSLEIKK